MILQRMNEDKFIGLIRVPEGVKLTSAACCQLLESDLFLGLSGVPILKRCKLKLQDNNPPSHSAKETQVLL